MRFIGNYSSGKMGFALAEECARRGAQVTLITGPVQLKTKHSRIRRVDVESAEEMYAASQIYFPDADAGILCAAVADYRPETVADKKIKREKEEELTLHLQATQDIAANLGALKGKISYWLALPSKPIMSSRMPKESSNAKLRLYCAQFVE